MMHKFKIETYKNDLSQLAINSFITHKGSQKHTGTHRQPRNLQTPTESTETPRKPQELSETRETHRNPRKPQEPSETHRTNRNSQ